jgi:hypothetical protein
MLMTNLSASFLTDVNGKATLEKDVESVIQMALKQAKALKLEFTVMAQGGNLVSALGSTPQYSRKKCMPLRHKWLRI